VQTGPDTHVKLKKKKKKTLLDCPFSLEVISAFTAYGSWKIILLALENPKKEKKTQSSILTAAFVDPLLRQSIESP
jgi:hypothetical protein